jgi:chemotaxis protein CheD
MISTPERAGETVVPAGQATCLRGSGTLVALGLGSSVAVLLHDSAHRVGGMAHVALPTKSLARDHANVARFAETAVPLLLDQVVAGGADRRDVVARIVGGASMFGELVPSGAIHMGQRNIAACRAVLRVLGVPVVAEAVGGSTGRSVSFDVARGAVTVASADGNATAL